jgi:hypothetical protein
LRPLFSIWKITPAQLTIPVCDLMFNTPNMPLWKQSDAMNQKQFVSEIVRLERSLPGETGPSPVDLDAFRKRFMPNNGRSLMERIEGKLREEFSTLSPDAQSLVTALNVDPDLLSPLAETRSETSHTRAIAYFLSPRFPKARKCAEALLKALPAELHEPSAPTNEAPQGRSKAEFYLDESSRADVSVTFGAWHILIEGKIDAAEGVDQRDRYCSWLTKHVRFPKKPLLVYLTVGRMNDDFKPCIPYMNMTFGELFDAWLPLVDNSDSQTLYFASYLKSVAMHLCEPPCATPGEFNNWPPSSRAALLERVKRPKKRT